MMAPITNILILLLASVLVNATGHLRLELTASNNCELRIVTDFSDEKIQLRIGEKRVTSFHPKEVRDNLKISLATANGKTVFYDFSMRKTDKQRTDLYEGSDLVVLIQSTFECNQGFFGLTCEFVGTPRTTKTTTTKTTTTTTTTLAPTTSKSQTTTRAEPPTIKTTTPQQVASHDSTIIIVLVVIIISFAALIIVFGFLLISSRRSQQHIIFADKTRQLGKEIEQKECKILMEEENVYEEIEDVRYTSAPLRSLYMPL